MNDSGKLVPLGELVTDLIVRPRFDRDAARAIEALEQWSNDAQGAFAANTERALRADWRVFSAFCVDAPQRALPASPETVRDFIRHCAALEKRPATMRRYLASIARAHRAANCANPCASEKVKLAMRSATKTLGAAQQQARALTWSEIARYLAIRPQNLRDARDRALVAVAYDSMCRSEELVALNVEHFTLAANGTATLLIERSKTDQAGEGAVVFLARTTVRLLEEWLHMVGIGSGALFPHIIGRARVGERLRPGAVATVFKRVGRWLQLPPADVAALSGHSARVGATQDLLSHNADISSVMQSGRWIDPRMVLRYGAHVLAERGAMARLAAAQGR